jgi:hypothetical protein
LKNSIGRSRRNTKSLWLNLESHASDKRMYIRVCKWVGKNK